MEPKPKQILYSPVDIDDADFADFDREPSEDEIEFQKFKDEFKQANEYAKVSVYRQPTTSDGRPGQKNLTFLFEAGVEEYSFSQLAGKLRDQYGTGTYRVQLRDKENLMKMNRAISIEAPKSDLSTDHSAGAIIEIVSRAMQEQQTRTEQMFNKLIGPQTGGDAIDQIVKITTAIAPILTALGISRSDPEPRKTLIEQMTEFQMMKELFNSGDGDSTLGGDANLYSLLSETVKAFGGPIAAAIAAGAESGELSPDGLATTARLTAPEPKTDEAMEAEKHKMGMRRTIHILIQNAKTGIQAEAFAGILVNNTPDDKQDELWDFISAEKCVDTIIALEPAAAEYREWFDALRLAVIALMADDPEPEKDLQDDTGESKVAEVQTVAGENDKDSPSDASQSDSDTPSDT